MAVFQGARLRTTALPAARPAAPIDRVPGRARMSSPAPTRVFTRVRPVGLLMAGILATTMLGLVYLTQTLESNATDTSIWRLERARTELAGDIRNQGIRASSLTERELIVRWAQKHDLRRLPEPLTFRVP